MMTAKAGILGLIIAIYFLSNPDAVASERTCLSSYTYVDSDSGNRYHWYPDRINYAQAKQKCASDDATLPILHSFEVDKERIKAQVALYESSGVYQGLETDVWLGLEQKSQFGYQWIDGVDVTVNPQTGLFDDDAYEHFEAGNYGVDINTLFSADGRKCYGSDGINFIFAWYEKPCEDTQPTLCVCYV